MDQGVHSRTRPAIIWLNVITVLSAAILISAEVLGLAFAGGWAIAGLFGLGEYGGYVLQTLLSAFGLVIVAKFIRAAWRVEPFTRG
jgi:hypothetical protein